ncbi:MAG: VOC family protein [Bacillota bacterium]|jgi:methylmalonyl-CoA/ethylmalonyl-CoA epimerase
MKSPLFTDVLQIGFVVRNCEKTAGIFAEKYGIGPWNIYGPESMTDVKQYNRECPMQLKVASTFLGKTELELIEPLDDLSLYADFLQKQGEGLHHLALKSNFNRAISYSQKHQIPVVLSGVFGAGEKFVYIDASADLKCIIELYDSQPGSSYPQPVKIIRG